MCKAEHKRSNTNYKLMGTKLESSKVIKDLGIYVYHDLTWKTHIEERLKKANKVLYLLRRNICCCCCCCWGFTVFTEGIFVPVVVLENCPIISADLAVTA